MTVVTSNAIRFTISHTHTNVGSSAETGIRKIFAGTPYYFGGKTDEPAFPVLAYSGCAYDPTVGKIYLFGGGHHDYSGNEVWEFSIDRPDDRWLRHYTPSSYAERATVVADVDNAARPGMYVSSGRPIARHTYYSLTFATNVGRMFAGGASTWDGPDGSYWSVYPNSPGDLWSYDPATRVWNYCGSSLVDKTMPVVSALVFHPQLGSLFTVSGRRTSTYDSASLKYSYTDGLPTVWEFDPKSNLWIDHGVALERSIENPLVALDSMRNRLILITWNTSRSMKLYAYDVSARSWSEQVTTGTLPPAPFGSVYAREGDRTVFSTLSRRLLYVSATNGGALFALDFDNWAWTELLPAGSFPEIDQAYATVWCPQRNEMYLTYKLVNSQAIDIIGVRA